MTHITASNHLDRPPRDDGRRTGAIWTGATGAFLLVAAATLFLAMRWEQVPPPARLGLVAGAAGASLLAGRTLRRSLPGVATVLFHLGGFLVPVAAAGVGIHAGLTWPGLTMLAGGAGWVTFEVLAASERSVVLRWSADVAAVVALVGVGAQIGVPAPVLVTLAALAARLAGRHRSAVWWAAVAALSPLATTAAGPLDPALLEAMGIRGPAVAPTAWFTGGLAAVVLAAEADRRRDPVLALLAGVGAAIGATASLVDVPLPASLVPVTAAGAFLLVELAAGLTRRDEFWGPLTALAALATEIAASVAGVVAAGAVLMEIVFGSPGDGHLAAALALSGTAWLVGDVRRTIGDAPVGWAISFGSGWPVASLAVSVSWAASAAALWGAAPLTSATWLVLAVLLVMSGRPFGIAIAAGLAIVAPLLAATQPAAGAGFSVVGGLVVAWSAVISWRTGEASPEEAGLLAVAACISPLLVGGLAAEAWSGGVGVLAALLTGWALALVMDTADPTLGHPARGVMIGAALIATGESPAAALAITLLATSMLALDAVRLDRHTVGYAAAVTAQAAAVSLGRHADLDPPSTGVLLVVAAITWAGAALVLPRRWGGPAWTAAGLAGVLGFTLALGRPDTASLALLAGGAAGMMAGGLSRRAWVGHVGGAAAIAGLWIRFELMEVTAGDLYVAPVAAQLVVAGLLIRRSRQLSSWAAYAPGIALLGCTALVERATDGGGVHSLVAGAVGAAAVAAGGGRRLAGPLFTGTALVVASTLVEAATLDIRVPTWAWMAAGGSALLGAAVAMERSAVSPVETGRRLVDVVRERFD